MYVGFLNLRTFLGHFKVFCFCFKKIFLHAKSFANENLFVPDTLFRLGTAKSTLWDQKWRSANVGFFSLNLWVMSAQIILLNIAFPDFLPPSQLLSSLLPSIKLHDKKERVKNIRETEVFTAPAFWEVTPSRSPNCWAKIKSTHVM